MAVKCEAEYVYAGDVQSGRCPTCTGDLVYGGVIGKTLVGDHSEPGHCHDDNCVSRQYVCANGHSVKLSIRRKCPACDWKGKEECFSCGSKKYDEWPQARNMEPDTRWWCKPRETR